MNTADLRRIQRESLISDVTLARVLTGRPLERATRKRFLDAAEKLAIKIPRGFFVDDDSRDGGAE